MMNIFNKFEIMNMNTINCKSNLMIKIMNTENKQNINKMRYLKCKLNLMIYKMKNKSN